MRSMKNRKRWIFTGLAALTALSLAACAALVFRFRTEFFALLLVVFLFEDDVFLPLEAAI